MRGKEGVGKEGARKAKATAARGVFGKRLHRTLGLLALAAPLALPSATTTMVEAKVTRLLAAGDGLFGGCMAMLDADLGAAGLNCSTRWVAFGCGGEFGAKADAQRLFDLTQLAFVLKRKTLVWVDDTRKIRGHCVAVRVDVI